MYPLVLLDSVLLCSQDLLVSALVSLLQEDLLLEESLVELNLEEMDHAHSFAVSGQSISFFQLFKHMVLLERAWLSVSIKKWYIENQNAGLKRTDSI